MASSQRDQQKEVVRLLTLQYGHKVASELSGVDYDVVRQWSVRGGWKASQTVTSPAKVAADNVAEIVKRNGSETKLGLSEYAKKQAQHLATKGKLKDHAAFRNLAAGANTVHGWNESQGQAPFSLNVLNLGGSVQIGVRNTDHVEEGEAPGTGHP